MSPSQPCPPLIHRLRTVALVMGAAIATAAHADIYKCRTPDGIRTSDRQMAPCLEQWQLNADGSRKRTIPAMLSDEERAAAEAEQRRLETKRAAEEAAQRRDQNLVNRFPTRAAHDTARKNALDTVDTSIRNSEKRIERLKAERKPLQTELEFYPDGKIPLKLKLAIDSNDALMEAQKQLIVNQQTEKARIDRAYDVELEKLKSLWGNAGGPKVRGS